MLEKSKHDPSPPPRNMTLRPEYIKLSSALERSTSRQAELESRIRRRSRSGNSDSWRTQALWDAYWTECRRSSAMRQRLNDLEFGKKPSPPVETEWKLLVGYFASWGALALVGVVSTLISWSADNEGTRDFFFNFSAISLILWIVVS